MTQSEETRILDLHSMKWKYENGKLYALEIYTDHEKWVDVTGWTKRKLYIWLGY